MLPSGEFHGYNQKETSMSLLNAAKAKNLNTQESDVLGGSYTVESNVYPAGVKMAYLDKSPKGAIFVALELALLVDGKERSHKESVYISNQAGGFTYKDKQGNEATLPGYLTVESICKAALGKSLVDVETATKSIQVYDYTQKDNVVKEKEVLIELLGKKFEAAILNIVEDKTTKADDGTYVPTGETRTKNELAKVFNEDGFTSLEVENKATEPKFKAAWLEKNQGKVINKATGAGKGVKTGSVAKPASAPLFG